MPFLETADSSVRIGSKSQVNGNVASSDVEVANWKLPKIGGYFFEVPHNKAYNILGSVLESPQFGSYQFVN